MVSRDVAPPERGKTMKNKSLGLTVLLVAFAGSALGQNHISGTLKCGSGKSDAELTVQVGDYDGHMLIIDKDSGLGSCTWIAPIEIAGLKTTGVSGVSVLEVNGAKLQDQGYDVQTMENGDKVYLTLQSTGSVTEGGKSVTYGGTWVWTGGTGKLKGIKGKGTFKGSGDPNVAIQSQIEGEYTLPAGGRQR